MKRTLGLALSFVICFSGLVLPAPVPARAQEVASVGGLGKLREQYERLLAIERDPSTPAEVRAINHNFLAERRAQLAAALGERVRALRTYQAGVAASLSADERRAVAGSIRRLVQELEALQPAPATNFAPAARPSRRASRAAKLRPVSEAADVAEVAAPAVESKSAGPQPADAEGSAARPEPTSDAPRKAAPIEIASPDRDRVVHTAEIELEVKVNDDDVDDLMVAVYTPASEKPKTARLFELKRSDRGAKSIVIALSKGDNRIEVSDLKRGGVLTTRTLTYAPTGDVLNSAPRAEAETAAPRDPSPFKKKLDAAKADPTHLAVICGQLQLASLNRTFALVKSTPALGDLAARFRVPDALPASPAADFIGRSQIKDGCEIDEGVGSDGLQRDAAIDLLRAVRLRLESDLRPKNTDINRTALRNETSHLLESTTTDPQIKAKARDLRGGDDQTADRAVSEYAKLERNSAFSSLSADTIRKQIVLLQQYLGNVEVRVTDGENVVDQVYADRDGNYVLTVPADASKTYTISTAGDEHFTTREVLKLSPGDAVRVNLDIEDRPVSLLARALIGYDQSGAAAAKRDFSYFFDFYVSKSFPFKQSINPDFGERWRLWGDFRINSVPQTADATLPDFAGTGFLTGIKNLKVKDTARVFEFLGGTEIRLTGNNALLPSFSRDTKQKFSLSFIGAFGYVTPVDPTGTTPTIFKVFNDAPGLPTAARGKEYVAFIPEDRDRFFRQYYAGLRVQTFFFNKYNVPLQRFPAQFDLTIGQNEFVTGGRLHGPVLRMEGFFPLPFDKAKFVNLFATAQMIPGRTHTAAPLILQDAPSTVTVPAANVLLLSLPQPNRDHYRIGVSFDAIPLIKRILQPPVPGNAATNSNSGNTNTNGNGNSNGNSNGNPSPNN